MTALAPAAPRTRTAVAVSVLLPVRNGAATIGAAVRSTLHDLPAAAELLVHDDASTDGTARVLARIRDPRLVVHRADAPVGVAAALNGLLERARGGWIGRMDGDDLTLPGRFSAELAALAAGDDLVFTSRINFGASWRAYRQDHMWPMDGPLLRLWLALENPLAHPAMLGRAEVLRAAGGYTAGPAEDWELWLRLAASGARLRRLALPGVAYRMHPGQVVRDPDWRRARAEDAALRAAHARLLAALGWQGDGGFDALFGARPDPVVRADLRCFLDAAAAALPPLPRALLRRRARALLG